MAIETFNATGTVNILSVTTGIDLKTVAATLLYTVPTGRKAIVTQIVIHATLATTVTVPAAASVGQNAASYNDIVAITTFTGLNITDQVYTEDPTAVYVSVPASTGIYLNVTTGATATALTAEIILIGFLV